MIFKAGLTIVVLVAIYMYFALQDKGNIIGENEEESNMSKHSEKQDVSDQDIENQHGDISADLHDR